MRRRGHSIRNAVVLAAIAGLATAVSVAGRGHGEPYRLRRHHTDDDALWYC